MDELEGTETEVVEEEAPEVEEVPGDAEVEADGGEGEVKQEEEPEKEPSIDDDIEAEVQKGIEAGLKVGSVNFSELKKEFPDLIKKHPELRDVIFRDQALTKIVGSVEGAKEMAEKSEIYDFMDESLSAGNPVPLVKSLADKSFEKFATSILPAIADRSPDIFVKATKPFIMNVLRNMESQEASGTKEGKNRAAAARIFYQSLFGGDYTIPKDESIESPALRQQREQLASREQQIMSEKADDFCTLRDNVSEQKLKDMISAELDPKMEKGIRAAVIDKVISEIDSRLSKDASHVNNMKALMRKAARSGFPRALVSQQVTAFLGRAKHLVGPVVQNYRTGNNVGKRVVMGKPVATTAPSSGKGKIDSTKIDRARTSTLDIFNDKITYRK